MKEDWQALLQAEMEQDYFRQLWSFLDEEYATQTVFPPKEQVYTALSLTGYTDTKVLILGQDPYHGVGQAHGLSFSVASEEAKYPPSLRNMFKELEADLGVKRTDRSLTGWTEQGVLLLNTVLTVRAGQAGSHRKKGWERFTDAIIRLLNARQDPVVFVMWGGDAKKKLPLLTDSRHPIIASAHPSPLSAHNGFFGSKPYSQVNDALSAMGKTTIDWTK